jgi:formylmethanofuran dehydrogenase subunit C
MKPYQLALAVAVLALVSACDGSKSDDSSRVNGSVHIAAGKQAGPAETVNGSVHIDENAAVTSATTVNGAIHMGAHSTAASLNTVNGSVTLDSGAHVSGDAVSVNGDLTLADGAEVSGSLNNVNGKISLTGAHVGGGIKTLNGSIEIMGMSRVEGGIWVQKLAASIVNVGNDVPRIVIGPGAIVQGDLRFERKVDLYVSDKATIGAVSGATPIAFTGDAPPK